MLGAFLSIFIIGLALFLGDYIINSQSNNSTVIAHSENYYYTMLYGTPFMILSIFFRSILSVDFGLILSPKMELIIV